MENKIENSDHANNNITLTEDDKIRYSRQMLLSQIGETGQIKLKSAKVIVIGAGGLGSSCLMHLTASGIGTICVIDNDNVEMCNLHRQVIHNMNNVGINKALSAKKFMNALNPSVNVIAIADSFTNKNSIDLCKNYDLIIDCCDNPKTRYLINDTAVLLNKPLISAASLRWDGQIGVYVKNCKGEKIPCYRCLHPSAPPKGSVKKCAEVGIIGTLPALIGTLEANEAIKLLLGNDEQILQRKVILLDGLDNKIKIMKTRNYQENCAVCGKNPLINKENISEYNYDSFINGESK